MNKLEIRIQNVQQKQLKLLTFGYVPTKSGGAPTLKGTISWGRNILISVEVHPETELSMIAVVSDAHSDDLGFLES